MRQGVLEQGSYSYRPGGCPLPYRSVDCPGTKRPTSWIKQYKHKVKETFCLPVCVCFPLRENSCILYTLEQLQTCCCHILVWPQG